MPRSAERTAGKQQLGRPFPLGQSGNPAGRPKGARNKSTLAAEALLDGEAEEITRQAIQQAKQGNMVAIRICLDRLMPPRRDRHVSFGLPAIEKAVDAATACASIVSAVSRGELTPSEAGELMKVVEGYARVLQAVDYEVRLEQLERALSV
jgi:hypothetical protein